MNDLEFVKICHGGHDLGKLNVLVEQEKDCGEITIEPTNCNRFAVILDFVYHDILPFGIHSVRMRKLCGSVEMETPSKGKILG